jgi:acetyltransferase
MSADACESNGLQVPEPSAALLQQLRSFLPAHSGLANPIDITVEGTAEQYQQALTASLREYDAALVIDVGTPYLAAMPIAQAVLAAARDSGKPVACNFEVGHDIAQAQQLLDQQGSPCFASGERAVRALAKLAEYRRLQQNLRPRPAEVTRRRLDTQLPSLLEYECMDLLSELQVATPPYRFVAAHEDVVAASEAIGYPQVMKIVSPQILHKSDVGGVKLNLANSEQAARAYQQLAAIGAGHDFRGVIIYPMLSKALEMIVGFSHDPSFGPVIVCGMGGVYTEILKDISLALAPVDERQALAMLQALKIWPLLNGARGAEPLAVDQLARLIARFSQLPKVYPQLKEGEINPVFVYADRAVAADARLILG